MNQRQALLAKAKAFRVLAKKNNEISEGLAEACETLAFTEARPNPVCHSNHANCTLKYNPTYGMFQECDECGELFE